MLYYDFNTNEVLSQEAVSTKYGTHIFTVHNSIKSVDFNYEVSDKNFVSGSDLLIFWH